MTKIKKYLKILWVKLKGIFLPFWKKNKDAIIATIHSASNIMGDAKLASKDALKTIKDLKKEYKSEKKK